MSAFGLPLGELQRPCNSCFRQVALQSICRVPLVVRTRSGRAAAETRFKGVDLVALRANHSPAQGYIRIHPVQSQI
jgi:hypothetical protein